MGGTNDVVESTSAARPDLVTCPVCGNTLPGESSTINSHLGLYQAYITCKIAYVCTERKKKKIYANQSFEMEFICSSACP